jgi:hypothetical protein
MRLATANGQRRLFTLDAATLRLLHDQLAKIEAAFPRCYVYKQQCKPPAQP